MNTAEAIKQTFRSENVPDSNGEIANVVDVIHELAWSMRKIADAITPSKAIAGKDSYGGTVTSLTEAIMGITSGLSDLASAVRDVSCSIEQLADKGRS